MTHPIILAHGVCRFDKLWNAALSLDNTDDPDLDRLHYFKGIRTMLKDKGFTVFHSNVSWGANVDRRALDLKRNILDVLQRTGADSVNIIAHSMGGLDARRMMFNDRTAGRIHNRIASLITISTPHGGTAFADWGVENLSQYIHMAKMVNLDMEAFKDLKTDRCRAFNEDPGVQAFESECEKTVRFKTYAGRKKTWRALSLFKLPAEMIAAKEGDNDGLVSVASAVWKEAYFGGVLEDVDHLNEIGWQDISRIWSDEGENRLLRRIRRFYAELAERLP